VRRRPPGAGWQDGDVLTAEFERSRHELWDLLRDLLASYAEHRPIRRVCVVGNAPLPPDAARAAEIDAGDLVVRANSLALDEPDAPPCVGSACHVVILSHAAASTPWIFRDYRKRAYLVPQAGFPLYYKVFPALPSWPADLGAIPIPNSLVKKQLVDRLDPGHQPGRLTPTSGTMGLYLAHEMFPDAELVATGFSFLDDQDQTAWQHHSGSSTAVHKYHDLSLESALLRSWIDDGSVRFLR
jgi:hypothetical protein